MSSPCQNAASPIPPVHHHQQHFVANPSPILKRETVDTKLLELFRKNYDIISVIADIERSDSPTSQLPTSPSSVASEKCMHSTDHSSPHTLSPRSISHHTIMCSSSISQPTTMLMNSPPKRRASLAVPLLQLGNSDGSVGYPLLVEEPASDTSSNSTAEELAVEALGETSSSTLLQQSTSTWTRVNVGLSRLCGDMLDALADTNEDLKAQNKPAETPPKLSAYALRRDIRRCLLESHSYLETLAGLKELFIWSNPIATLSIFLVYMYSVFRGWLVTLTLFLLLIQLGFNYLSSQKRINLGLRFLPRKELQAWKLDLSGAQLVFDVARRTQVMLTFAADCLEKFKYLFSWKKPEVTLKFLFIVLTFFLLSLVLSTGWWFTVVGFLMGGKAFLTTYMYHRFPRLRPLFDVLFYFYNHLPTSRNGVLQATHSKSNLTSLFQSSSSTFTTSKWSKPDGYCLNSLDSSSLTLGTDPKRFIQLRSPSEKRRCSISVIPMSFSMASAVPSPLPSRPSTPLLSGIKAASTSSNFSEVISALRISSSPQEEKRLEVEPDETTDGTGTNSDTDIGMEEDSEDVIKITRSCVLVDKSKPFPRNMSTGTLILSDRLMTFRFRQHKNYGRKNCQDMLEFPFDEIIELKKIRSLKTLLSLSGKGIELKLAYRKKTIQLVGISKRDEFYESLIETARIADVELVTSNIDHSF